MTETRRAWRLAIFQARSGLWQGYAGQAELRLMSRGPTPEVALESLRAIVDEFDAVMDSGLAVTDTN